MNPTFWPNLAQFPTFLATILTAFLCIGIGRLAGITRAEIALAGGWGIAGLVTVTLGTLTGVSLPIVMRCLGLAGFAGLALEAVQILRRRPVLECRSFLQVFLLGIPLLFFLEGMVTAGWDDFSHWLPNLTYLCQTGHFPTLADPVASHHAAYPYGMALVGFSVFLMTGQIPENAAIIWNALLIFMAAAAVSNIIQRSPVADNPRLFSWAASSASLCMVGLLCPSFVAKIAFCNMNDSGTGSLLVVLAAVCYDFFRLRGRNIYLWGFTFGVSAAAFINLRQTNLVLLMLVLLGFGISVLLNRRRVKPVPAVAWLIMIAIPIWISMIWSHYSSVQIPGGAFAVLPISQWHWHELPGTIESIFNVIFEKLLFFVFEFYVVWRLGRIVIKKADVSAENFALLAISTILILGNIGFLAFTYLAGNFNAVEAAKAASFWRYVGQTGPLALMAILVTVPFSEMAFLKRKRVLQCLVCFAFLYPIISAKLYRYDIASPVPVFRKIAAETDRLVPAGKPVELEDISSNGFLPLIMQYQFSADHNILGLPQRNLEILASPFGFAADSLAGLPLKQQPYIVLVDGAKEMDRAFGYPVEYDCSYLFKNDNQSLALVKAWDLGINTARTHGYSTLPPPSGHCADGSAPNAAPR